jgi:hypothetical protein
MAPTPWSPVRAVPKVGYQDIPCWRPAIRAGRTRISWLSFWDNGNSPIREIGTVDVVPWRCKTVSVALSPLGKDPHQLILPLKFHHNGSAAQASKRIWIIDPKPLFITLGEWMIRVLGRDSKGPEVQRQSRRHPPNEDFFIGSSRACNKSRKGTKPEEWLSPLAVSRKVWEAGDTNHSISVVFLPCIPILTNLAGDVSRTCAVEGLEVESRGPM